MYKLLLIGLGGAGGSILRYLVSQLLPRTDTASFPAATLIVNVTGCLAIGVLGTMFAGRWSEQEQYRLAIVVGVLGGYTTFSAFGRETLDLVNTQHYAAAGIYLTLSNLLGLASVWLGHVVARRYLGA